MNTILKRLLVAGVLAPLLVGCAREPRPSSAQESWLENLPFVYRMTVQQGNLLREERVDQLQLGMTRRQVEFLMGTPLLMDFFHPDRWDYTYTIRRGHQPMEIRRLTLFFDEDTLVRIEGDVRPDPSRAQAEREQREIVVTVPDYEGRRGLFRR